MDESYEEGKLTGSVDESRTASNACNDADRSNAVDTKRDGCGSPAAAADSSGEIWRGNDITNDDGDEVSSLTDGETDGMSAQGAGRVWTRWPVLDCLHSRRHE